MLKRLFAIAFFTGTGQLFSVFALKYIAQHSSSEQLRGIAEIDSIVLLITNVIALGLQSAAMRDLALNDDWKSRYYDTQSARITLGLVLTLLSFLAFINPYYLAFMVAPILAWSGDYALYGRNQAVTGSVVSFIRVLFPFAVLTFLVKFNHGSLPAAYIFCITTIYTLTNLVISWRLGAPFFFKPRIESLTLYLHSLYLGLVNLLSYFIGLGLLLIIPYFYKSDVVSVAYIGLKFYVIYKGAMRIIHQAFVKDMIYDAVCLKVDQLSILAAVTFLGSMICFPDAFVRIFFGVRYLPHVWFFFTLSVAALCYSIFLSMGTKSMLEKKDKAYARVTAIATLVTVSLVAVLPAWWPTSTSIAISLVAGEAAWTVGLVTICAKEGQVGRRLIFLLETLLFLLVPLSIRYFTGDKTWSYFMSFGLFGATLLAFNFKKFKSVGADVS